MLLRPLAIIAALVLGTLAASLANAGTGDDSAESSRRAPTAALRVEHAETEASSLAAQLEAVTGRAAAQEYFLTYKLGEGEVIRTAVTHNVTVETSIQGNTQTAKSSSGSTKRWTILEVAENGDITFELVIEHINMAQEVSGREGVSYDSRTGDPPPLDYEEAASTVGEVLAHVTMNHHGRVIERENPDGDESKERQAQLGFGDIAVPLPESNVKVGDQWFLPMSYRVRLPSEQFQVIQMRHRYQLEAVEGNIAVISMHTERLTPVTDPQVESQLMQQMQNGEIRFDMAAGRLVSKSLNLDEMVIGFQGANSRMKYIGRYREAALEEAPGETQAAAPATEDTQAATTSEPPIARVAAAPEREAPPALSDDDGSGTTSSGSSQYRQRRMFRR